MALRSFPTTNGSRSNFPLGRETGDFFSGRFLFAEKTAKRGGKVRQKLLCQKNTWLGIIASATLLHTRRDDDLQQIFRLSLTVDYLLEIRIGNF